MNITDTNLIQHATVLQLKAIDKALVAAAYKIRDKVRNTFTNNGRYNNINTLSEGIMLGKLENSSIKLHAFGYNDSEKKTYKTRFFVGGTKERYTKKRRKKKYRGKIEAIDSINKGLNGAESILNNFIKLSLE